MEKIETARGSALGRLTAVLLTALTVVLLTAGFSPVFADELLGSITVTAQDYDSGQGLPGRSVGLYKIAEFDDLDYTIYRDGFEDFTESDGISSLAQEFSGRITETGMEAEAVGTTNSEGKILFSDLTTGVYLVRDESATEDYESFDPFTVSIPMEENGTLVYNVDAEPKGGLSRKEAESIVPVSEIVPVSKVEGDENQGLQDSSQEENARILAENEGENTTLIHSLKTGVEDHLYEIIGLTLCLAAVAALSFGRREALRRRRI